MRCCFMRPRAVCFWSLLLFLLLMTCDVVLAQQKAYYSPDLMAMQGSWIRTDAPYVIELRHSKSSGLKATYFNRRYINVEKTETAVKDGLQYVMIKLQDANYDGSLYLLSYYRSHDMLKGVYMLGSNGQRFQVSFSRKPKAN